MAPLVRLNPHEPFSVSRFMTKLHRTDPRFTPYEKISMAARDALRQEEPSADELEYARCVEQAREHRNPFPFIYFQWESLRSTNPKVHKACRWSGEFDNPDDPPLKLEFWQRQIIQAVFDPEVGELFIKGATGVGKGACVGGIAMNALFDTHDICRLHMTSDGVSHAVQNIYSDFTSWRRQMRMPGPGEIQATGTKDRERHYVEVLGARPNEGEKFSGRHSEFTVFVFDEASAVPDVFYENCLKNARKVIALSNPRTVSGWFREGFRGLQDEDKTDYTIGPLGRRLCITVGGKDCTNVNKHRLKTPIAPIGGLKVGEHRYASGDSILKEHLQFFKLLIPSQISYDRYQGIMSDPEKWKRDCYGNGKFITEDVELQVVLSSWLQRHIAAWKEVDGRLPVECFGFDVARSLGGDDNVLTGGGKYGVCGMPICWKAPTYEESIKLILQHCKQQFGVDLLLGQHPICIDMGGGFGGGIAEPLRKLGAYVIEYHPAGAAWVDPKTYLGIRTESYALLGRRLSPTDRWKDTPFALPADPVLATELCAPHKLFPNDDRSRFRLESKDDVKRKLKGRSPDKADSLVLLFYAIRLLHNLNAIFSYDPIVNVESDTSGAYQGGIADYYKYLEDSYGAGSESGGGAIRRAAGGDVQPVRTADGMLAGESELYRTAGSLVNELQQQLSPGGHAADSRPQLGDDDFDFAHLFGDSGGYGDTSNPFEQRQESVAEIGARLWGDE